MNGLWSKCLIFPVSASLFQERLINLAFLPERAVRTPNSLKATRARQDLPQNFAAVDQTSEEQPSGKRKEEL